VTTTVLVDFDVVVDAVVAGSPLEGKRAERAYEEVRG